MIRRTRRAAQNEVSPTDLDPEAVGRQLAALPRLASLSLAAQAGLAHAGAPRRFRRSAQILAEGEHPESFFVVLEGRVKLQRLLANGRHTTRALLGPGDVFGVPAALGARACEGAALALEPALCLDVSCAALFALIESRPALLRELLPLVTRELVECRHCIGELSCYRVETRFALLLLKLADSVGAVRPEGTFIPVRLKRRDLADMTGTTVETTIRVMSRWGKHGLVETRRNGFVLRQRAAVENLALP